MRTFLLFVSLVISASCFAQSKTSQSQLMQGYLTRAEQTTEYKTVVENVKKVKENVKLANQKLLKADSVVKDYNLKLGDNMGIKSTLKEVEELVNKDGDEFIRVVLLKTAARLAREDAAFLNSKQLGIFL